MRWLAINKFQVADDAPVRSLKELGAEENLLIMLLVLAVCKVVSEDVKRENRALNEAGDPSLAFISDELSQAQLRALCKITSDVEVCQKKYSFPYVPIMDLDRISPHRTSELIGAILVLLNPGFTQEEYEKMSDGEAKDVIIALKKITNRRSM